MTNKSKARDLLNDAKASLETAKYALDNCDLRSAGSRAYYSMYYAAHAALLLNDLEELHAEPKSHSGLISAFSLHLVKNGPVPKEMGRLLNRAQEARNIADYLDDMSVGIADELVNTANIFVPTIISLFIAPPGEPDEP